MKPREIHHEDGCQCQDCQDAAMQDGLRSYDAAVAEASGYAKCRLEGPKWMDWPEHKGLYAMCPSHIRSAADLVRVTLREESYLSYTVIPFKQSWGEHRLASECRWYGPIPEDENDKP